MRSRWQVSFTGDHDIDVTILLSLESLFVGKHWVASRQVLAILTRGLALSGWKKALIFVSFISERVMKNTFIRTNQCDRLFDLVQKVKVPYSSKDHGKIISSQNVGSKHGKSLYKVVYKKANKST